MAIAAGGAAHNGFFYIRNFHVQVCTPQKKQQLKMDLRDVSRGIQGFLGTSLPLNKETYDSFLPCYPVFCVHGPQRHCYARISGPRIPRYHIDPNFQDENTNSEDCVCEGDNKIAVALYSMANTLMDMNGADIVQFQFQRAQPGDYSGEIEAYREGLGGEFNIGLSTGVAGTRPVHAKYVFRNGRLTAARNLHGRPESVAWEVCQQCRRYGWMECEIELFKFYEKGDPLRPPLPQGGKYYSSTPAGVAQTVNKQLGKLGFRRHR